MYANGLGVRQDYVQALMWLRLAASAMPAGPNRDTAASVRDDIARRMTQEQIAEAERLAREWRPAR
jgi:uncharacterized protein